MKILKTRCLNTRLLKKVPDLMSSQTPENKPIHITKQMEQTFATPSISFYLTTNQTGSVSISSRVASSANIALNATTIDSGPGAFTLGDSSANVLNIIELPSSSGNPIPIHNNLNNSARNL
jgi:hypothetical protein